MKGLLKRAFARVGYSVRSRPRLLAETPALELRLDLSFVLAHLLLRRPDAFVVQVGAYDGQANDPLFEYMRRFDLGALLIEPQPAPFDRLAAIYADRPKVRTCRAAVSDRDGVRDLYRLDTSGGGLPEWAEQTASFRREVILSHAHVIPDIADRIVAEPVPARTFDSLFQEYGVARVNVLLVDAEGYDYEVLKLFPFNRHLPELVRYEHAHLSAADQDACLRLLAGLGYLLWVPDLSGMDTIAYLPPAPLPEGGG